MPAARQHLLLSTLGCSQCLQVTAITAKQLISPVTGDRDSDLLTRKFRDHIGRHTGGIGIGFIHAPRKITYLLNKSIWTKQLFGVLGSEEVGKGPSLLMLTLRRLFKTDGKGPDGPLQTTGDQGYRRRGVDTSGEKSPHRYIGDQAAR